MNNLTQAHLDLWAKGARESLREELASMSVQALTEEVRDLIYSMTFDAYNRELIAFYLDILNKTNPTLSLGVGYSDLDYLWRLLRANSCQDTLSAGN